MTDSKRLIYEEALLSQKLSDKDSDFQELAGSDPAISKKIQRIKWMVKYHEMTQEEAQPILDLLNGDRKAAFATSPNTNEVTKMGLMLPKAEFEISKF